MVKLLTAGGRGTSLPVGPFIFRKIMSGAAGFLTRHTTKGPAASLFAHINFSGEKRTWTCAYRMVSTYLKCPSITSAPSIDAATAVISPLDLHDLDCSCGGHSFRSRLIWASFTTAAANVRAALSAADSKPTQR